MSRIRNLEHRFSRASGVTLIQRHGALASCATDWPRIMSRSRMRRCKRRNRGAARVCGPVSRCPPSPRRGFETTFGRSLTTSEHRRCSWVERSYPPSGGQVDGRGKCCQQGTLRIAEHRGNSSRFWEGLGHDRHLASPSCRKEMNQQHLANLASMIKCAKLLDQALMERRLLCAIWQRSRLLPKGLSDRACCEFRIELK